MGKLIKICAATALFLCIACYFKLATIPREKLKLLKGSQTKTILYRSTVLGTDYFLGQFVTGKAVFDEVGCMVTDCVFWNINDGEPANLPFEEFDAVVFNVASDAISLLIFGTLSGSIRRQPHQRYIFYAQESPAHLPSGFSHFDNFFNWTFTYRRDSDIWFPSGRFIEKYSTHFNQQLSNKLPAWFAPNFENMTFPKVGTNKKKLVAWVVSNCATESKREWYVAELSQHIGIDVYGSCGSYYCNNEECFTMIERDYKFYLAFENSLCEDYVTEKFFRTMQYNIVPIVYGGADYKSIAPTMSYIDIKDFNNTAHLAEYLKYLDRNPQEYQKFFWWKPHYTSQRLYKEPICKLCEMLHNPDLPKNAYRDIESWWNVCHSPSKHFTNANNNWKIGNSGRYSVHNI